MLEIRTALPNDGNRKEWVEHCQLTRHFLYYLLSVCSFGALVRYLWNEVDPHTKKRIHVTAVHYTNAGSNGQQSKHANCLAKRKYTTNNLMEVSPVW